MTVRAGGKERQLLTKDFMELAGKYPRC